MRDPNLTDLGFLFGVCQHQRDHLSKVKDILSETVANNQREGIVGDKAAQTVNEVMQLVYDVKELNWWMSYIESLAGKARIQERRRLNQQQKEARIAKELEDIPEEDYSQHSEADPTTDVVTMGHAKNENMIRKGGTK